MIPRGAHANIPPFVDFAPGDDAVKRMKTTPTTTVWYGVLCTCVIVG